MDAGLHLSALALPKENSCYLDGLPEEVLLEILNNISYSTHDYYSLSLVSKKLNRIVTPFLYTTILLSTSKKPTTDSWPTEACSKLEVIKANLESTSRYIRHFGFSAHVFRKQYHSNPAAELGTEVILKIPPGQLRSFIWELNNDCPRRLLDFLNKHQRNIETFVINVHKVLFAGHRPDESLSTLGIDFPAFANLRHLCLYGYLSLHRRFELIPKLVTLFPRLETFSLLQAMPSFLFFNSYDGNEEIEYTVEKSRYAGVNFPALKTLVFDQTETMDHFCQNARLLSLSQMPHLESLYARGYWSIVLIANLDPIVPIRLTTLEIHSCSKPILAKFLLSFKGLINLDILGSSEEDDYVEAAAIINHSSTLKRLALWRGSTEHPGPAPSLIPLPTPFMHELGTSLGVLKELCAPLSRTDDPFEGGRFPSLKLLWIYNMNPNTVAPDFEPEYLWLPSIYDDLNNNRGWLHDDPYLILENAEVISTGLPKNLKAVATGHIRRSLEFIKYREDDHDFAKLEASPRLYELMERGNKLVWLKRNNMRDFATRHPDLLSPYEEGLNVPIIKHSAVNVPVRVERKGKYEWRSDIK